MSEIPPQPGENNPLKTFHEHVKALVKESLDRGEVHFGPEFNAEELTAEDMEILKKLEDRALTRQEIADWINEVKKSGNKSRREFNGYIANESTELFL